jgi:choline dehydrogenase-like flavoprotein
MGRARLRRPAEAVVIRDPIREGIAAGWKVVDAARLERDLDIEADVAVIGSGAGGGVTAEILSAAGLRVAIVEAGPLVSSSEFRMQEAEAYPRLYQESAAQKTRDRSITILQGRCVGGSTTVNWTASFRTPPRTLAHWRAAHGLKDTGEAELAPWFERMEQRLSIAPWPTAPNQNNAVLARGCQRLGIASAVIPRNVRGCANLGYCGVGCPTNAKQSMLVTTIPAALQKGATLLHGAPVERLVAEGGSIAYCEVKAPRRVRVRARHFVLAAGAIGSPAVLMRSRLPDPHERVGRRTFLHPTLISGAVMRERVDAHAGAPQSVYSDHFLDALALDGPAGFKLEVPPVHPILASTTLPGFGRTHAELMQKLPHLQVTIALLRDGFHAESPGGRVRLRGDGSAELDYSMSRYLWDGARRALLAMAEIQFAAGAVSVHPLHEEARPYASWREAKDAIEALEMRPLRARVASAHVMGGCAMGPEAREAVVDESGRHHHVANLSVHDGSLFPTSLGANPQLSIYGITARLASRLADSLRRA